MHHLSFFSIKIKTGKINHIRSCIYWSVLGLLMPFGCCEWFGMSTCADVPVGSAYREGVEFLCRMVILFLMFWGLCFPRGHITLTLPALAVRGFQIFTTSPAHYRVVVEDRRQNFFLGIWKCFLWKHGRSSQSQPLANASGEHCSYPLLTFSSHCFSQSGLIEQNTHGWGGKAWGLTVLGRKQTTRLRHWQNRVGEGCSQFQRWHLESVFSYGWRILGTSMSLEYKGIVLVSFKFQLDIS